MKWVLQRALYGLPESPMLWNKTLVGAFKKLGYKQSTSDPCMFICNIKPKYVVVAIIVDDLLVASKREKDADQLIKDLSAMFRIKNMDSPKYVIDIHIDYDQKKRKMRLNQQLYIQNIDKRFGADKCKPSKTAVDPNQKLHNDMNSKPTKMPYRELIGSLIYATLTRPDICVIVSQLSRYLENPQEAHWKSGMRVLRFLYYTKEKSLTFIFNGQLITIEIYSDSTWNSDRDTSRSRTGYLIYLNGCLIAWKSKLQPMVTLSSTEAEYVALNDAAKEGIWVRRMAGEVGHLQELPTTINVDNMSTIALAENQMTKPRTKHIAMRYHWIREQIKGGNFKLAHVASELNKADVLTKVKAQKVMEDLLGFELN